MRPAAWRTATSRAGAGLRRTSHLVGLHRPQRQRELALALLLVLCVGFFRQVPIWNESSRYDLTAAIVDNHTTRIDQYQQNTGDKAYYKGHYYSDKSPGSSLLAIPLYLGLHATAALHGDAHPSSDQSIAVFAFFLCGVPTVLVCLMLLRLLRTVVPEWWALTVAAAFGLGTIALPFATMFFGHAPQTAAIFAAFYLTWRAPSRGSIWRPVSVGLLLGLAVLIDVSSAAAVLLLLGYAFWRDRRFAALVVVGGAPCALVLLGYDWVCFDNPLSLSYNHLVPGAFADGQGKGVLGVSRPTMSALRIVTIGQRGLLRLSPWLAAAPLGLLAVRRREVRREVLVAAAVAAAYLMLNAGYFLPVGGATPGPRFLSPAIPFFALLVALAPSSARIPVCALATYSVALTLAATATMPNALEGVIAPISDLWLPRLRAADLAETSAWQRLGLHGAEPLVVLGSAAALVAAVLCASALTSRRSGRAATGGLVALAVLVGALGTPVQLPRVAFGDRAGIAVVDQGVDQLPPTLDEGSHFTLWTQVGALDSPPSSTRVVFEVRDPRGSTQFEVYYGDVGWHPQQRQRMSVDWKPSAVASGDYLLVVSIDSDDGSSRLTSLSRSFNVGP